MSETWIELQVETTPDGAELVAATLAELTGGVEIRDAGTMLATAADRSIVVALCRPDELDGLLETIDEILTIARGGGAEVDPVAIRQRPAHEDEWRDVWKQFFRATPIGRHFVVRPSWDQNSTVTAPHVIELDPGRAFGTGAHASTRLVIQLVEDIADGGTQVTRFLDLGCGSGILAIVAARLWPQARGLAVDVDPEATACTEENFERNQITSLAVRTGTLDEVNDRHELVMANIQADVLTALAPQFPARLAAGGELVLAGLLTGDVDGVVEAMTRAGLTLVSRADEGEWAALRLRAA